MTRSAIDEHPAKGRDTMGVKFVGVSAGDAVAVVARSVESALDNDLDGSAPADETAAAGESVDQAEGATIDGSEPPETEES